MALLHPLVTHLIALGLTGSLIYGFWEISEATTAKLRTAAVATVGMTLSPNQFGLFVTSEQPRYAAPPKVIVPHTSQRAHLRYAHPCGCGCHRRHARRHQ
jgi:hypothetical protein